MIAATEVKVWHASGSKIVLPEQLSLDDSAAKVLVVLQEALGTKEVYAWIRTPLDDIDPCQARGVALELCSMARDPTRGGGLLRRDLLKEVLNARVITKASKALPKHFLSDEDAPAIVTWKQAVDVVLSVCAEPGSYLLSPLGFRASQFQLPVNPLAMDRFHDVLPNSRPEPEPSMTLERFDVSSLKEVHIMVMTLDDVRQHLVQLPQLQPQAHAPDKVISSYLSFYFPAAYDDVQMTAAKPASSFDTVKTNSRSTIAITPNEYPMMIVRSMHMVLDSGIYLSETLATEVTPIAMRDAFLRLPLSSNTIDAVRMIQVDTNIAYRVTQGMVPSVATAAQHAEVLRILNSNVALNANRQHQQQLACFRKSPSSSAWWSVVLSRTHSGALDVDVHMLPGGGGLRLSVVEAELQALKDTVLTPLLTLVAPSDTWACFNTASWFHAWKIGTPQRLSNILINTAFQSDIVTPTSASIAKFLSGLGTVVNNVQVDGSSVVFQYCMVDGYTPLSAAQQIIRLNSAVPVPVLLGLLQGRYGMERQQAQQLLASELGAIGGSKPVLVVVRIVDPGRVQVSISGPIHEFILNRIHDMLSRAISSHLPSSSTTSASTSTSSSSPGITSTQAFAPVNLSEPEPIELASLLAGLEGELSNEEDDDGGDVDEQVNREVRDQDQQDDVPGRYIISDLRRGDPRLFDTGSKDRKYSRICGHVVLRQPVRMSPEELARNEQEYPGAVTGSISTGSSSQTAAANRYICPKVWCPRSRTALTMEQYHRLGKRCPGTVNEEALVFDDNTYWKGRNRYPGLLDPKFHPDGLCMPCCFLKPNRKKAKSCHNKNDDKNEQQKGVSTSDQDDALGNARYIYNASTVLPGGRYGFLPSALHEAMNPMLHSRQKLSSHMTNRMVCVLRKGIATGANNIYACLAQVLGIEPNIVELIRLNLEPEVFLALHSGHLAQAYISRNPMEALADAAGVAMFSAWLTSPAASLYVSRCGLEDVRAYVASGKLGGTSHGRIDDEKGVLDLRAVREYALFQAMQRYFADLEASRTHALVLDLVNMGLPWLNPNGIYVAVIISAANTPNQEGILSLPVYSGSTHVPMQRIAMLIQMGGSQYEVVTRVTVAKAGILDEFDFDAERLPGPRAVAAAAVSLTKAELSNISSVKRTLPGIVQGVEMLGASVTHQVVNYEMQCTALVVHPGILVPLRDPQAIVVKSTHRDSIRMIFVDALPSVLTSNKASLDQCTTFFARLAGILQDPEYEVVHVIELAGGGQGLLLAMGKVSPLSSAAAYMAVKDQINAFTNIPIQDDRVKQMHRVEEVDQRIDRLLQKFLAVIEQDAKLLMNMNGILGAGCPVPWDVRHRYVVWAIRQRIPDAADVDASRVADRLLLGVRHRGWEGQQTDDSANVIILSIPAGRLLQDADLTSATAAPQAEASIIQLKPQILDADAGMVAHIQVYAGATTQSKKVSRRSRKPVRTSSKLRAVKMDVMAIPLGSVNNVLDVVLHASRILHPNSGATRSVMQAILRKENTKTPLDALLLLSRRMQIPVANFDPNDMELHLQEGGADGNDAAAILVHVDKTSMAPYLLVTRQRRDGEFSPEVYGVLVHIKDLLAPYLKLRVHGLGAHAELVVQQSSEL